MKRLWLLRHAKSSWDDLSLPDPDRPLAPRGQRAARLLAAHLAASDVRPRLVLCSSSLRTRQTLAAILPALGDDLEVRIEPATFQHYAAAEWEFEYEEDGEMLHVIDLGFVTDEFGGALLLQAPKKDWKSYEDELEVFKATADFPF